MFCGRGFVGTKLVLTLQNAEGATRSETLRQKDRRIKVDSGEILPITYTLYIRYRLLKNAEGA